ncbi:hypothetical protein GQ44DRAFT_243412 [Phaeosphaeriaceae sp. PMI808]|nr:hypothetical protein GQ44DRAFT_243412 [Phaeosphaeriaceae sp. PMI808]
MAQTYDFIIVGAGTAGCLLAHRLSHAPAKPSVLLLEAGSKPEGDYLSAPFHRYAAVALRPDLDHGYVSEPEPALNGRQISYARGKGLGGSSVLNFGVYLYGSGEDYNRWGELVGDDDWKWDAVKKSYHTIENYDFEGAKAYVHLADPSSSMHGTQGSLKVGLPPVLELGVLPQMEAMIEAGEKLNLDPNSGDPTGLSVFPYSYSTQGRSTSAIAHLLDPPQNLEVWTDATVVKLLFDGTKVVGVVTADGRKASTSKEVILCGGAIDTPRLLLLNGIGPKSELEPLGIEVKKDLPGVGKHLQDHVMVFMSVEADGSINERTTFETNPQLVAEAEELWKKDQTGAFALQHSTLWGGFLKIPGIENTAEFKKLSPGHQEYLSRETVPSYEFIKNGTLWPPGTAITPGNTYMSFIAFLMNSQSEGSVTLRSKNAADKPVLRLNYLTHPFDVLTMREAIRITWNRVLHNPRIGPTVRKTITGPASLSDEDIDAYARENAGTVWHANGTVRMGREEDGNSVDTNGKVHGLQGLRVADLSVCPVTTNNHTQSTAYLVGQKISEKMMREYGLDKA